MTVNNDLLSVNEMDVIKDSDANLIGNRISVDLEHNNIETVQEVAPLNGWVGDDGRVVRFKLFNGRNQQGNRQVQSVSGMSIALGTVDADGVPKITRTFTRVNDSAGEFDMKVPGSFYQAAGRVKEAFLFIYSDFDQKTLIGSVPISFIVRNKLLEVALNSKPFDNAFVDLNQDLLAMHNKLEATLKKFTTEAADNQNQFNDELRKKYQEFLKVQEEFNELKRSLEFEGIGLRNADNEWTKGNTFLEVIKGHITGTEIARFTADEPVQDLNNLDVLRNMKIGTSETSYYSGNKLENNPMTNDWVLVTRHKISDATVYETAMTFDGKGYGVLMARTVGNLTATPALTDWGVFSEWGSQWKSLVPFLHKDWTSGEVEPMYKIDGDEVTFVGTITPRKTLTNDTSGNGKVFVPIENLPFEFISGQTQVEQGSGFSFFTLFARSNFVEAQKYNNAGKPVDVISGYFNSISAVFKIKR